ncbi:MAG TPA: hypothetical protein VMH22_04500 [bacterium]|nr:hypothetical protein [bacterium]
MGDSGLTAHPGIAALASFVLALVMAGVAWRIPKRSVRVGIGWDCWSWDPEGW